MVMLPLGGGYLSFFHSLKRRLWNKTKRTIKNLNSYGSSASDPLDRRRVSAPT